MTVDDSIDKFCTVVGPLLHEAEDLGIRLAVEPSAPANHDIGCIHSLRDALSVADDTGLDVVVDLQTCWVERGIGRMFKRNVGRIALVQVSDFIVGTESRLERAVPGDGDLPLEALISDLLTAGYDGLFDLEILGRRIEDEGYAAAIRRGVDWLSECLTRLGA
jgi:sugar phosphate isomerase/epimerase